MSDIDEHIAAQVDATSARSGGVPAIDRALNVMECLAQSRKGYSVSELSRRLALPKSSVHLIARTLECRGYLQKQQTGGRYKLGMKLIALGRTALDGVDLRDHARPVLGELSRTTGLTVHLGVIDQGEIVIIDVLESASPVRVVSWVGRRMNVHSTAIGQALVAHLPGRQFEAQTVPGQPAPHDERASSKVASRELLERARLQGYAVCEEEEAIVRSVGAPILDRHGHAIAAISVAGTTLQVPTKRIDGLGQAVKDAAKEISDRVQG